jgi:broad specificity phosphatase PhoE
MRRPEAARTIIGFRHGETWLNRLSHLTGQAAIDAMATPIPSDADAIMDVTPEGRLGAEFVRDLLADMTIHACLRSMALRTKTTAEIVFSGRTLPGGIIVEPALRERSRGRFSYAPHDWSITQPDFPRNKSVLDWVPAGVDYNGNPGESLRQVRDMRVRPVLARAAEVAPGGAVALSGHAEWMGALRARILGFDDERFRQPLVPGAPNPLGAIAAKMIFNTQTDMYSCICINPPSAVDHMDIFRSVGIEPASRALFDTGWIAIDQLR